MTARFPSTQSISALKCAAAVTYLAQEVQAYQNFCGYSILLVWLLWYFKDLFSLFCAFFHIPNNAISVS